MNTSSMLILASATVVFALGFIHLVYTFRGSRLAPRNPGLKDALESSSLNISSQTTVWKAWIGFNASHSIGAMLFGSIYGYLALYQSALLFASTFLGIVGALVLVTYATLGWLYWFSTPFRGIMLALVLYLAGFSIALAT